MEKDDDTLRHGTIVLETPQRTYDWGTALGRLLLPGDVIALEGDLGAGKTTLTKGIAAGMGIHDEVTSPTFTLVHEYRGRVPMFHLDPYRLDRSEDLLDLGFEEYLDRSGVMIVEWADRLTSILPTERLTLKIEMLTPETQIDDSPRRVVAHATGERYVQLLTEMSALSTISTADDAEQTL